MVESLCREIGEDGIRVTVIEPGAVRTEFAANMRDDVRSSTGWATWSNWRARRRPAMLYAVSQPPRVNVDILTFYPTQQA
jgi:NADP-dependent 3-hydroxy acid dehydrogenase YdfG